MFLDTVNRRISAFRRYYCLTQEDVARELGLKPSTYSQKERHGNIEVEFLVKLSKILNADFLDLAIGLEEAKKYREKIISDYIVKTNINPETEKKTEEPKITIQEPDNTDFKFTYRECNLIGMLRNMKRSTANDIYKAAYCCIKKKKSLAEAVKEISEV